MESLGGGRSERAWEWAVIVAGPVIVLWWVLAGGASAGGLEALPKGADQLEALAFDPFRLVTEQGLLASYQAALNPAPGAGGGQSGQPVASSSSPSVAANGAGGGNPVPSSSTAGITTLASAAALVKVFVSQALVIAPRPPLRTPTRPTWP